MVVCPTGSPISAQVFWSSFRVTVGFLFISMAKALLSQMPNLAGWSTLGRFKVVPNIFQFKIIEATVVLEALKALEIAVYPCPDLCLASLITEIRRQFLGLHGLIFVSTMQCNLWFLTDHGVCPINSNCKRWTPVEFKTHLKDN